MRVRSIDSDNDWLFGKGQNDYKTSTLAIGQSIQTRLQSFLGDCFFALADGLDWFNLIGSKNLIKLKLDVGTTILNTSGVLKIISVDFNLDSSRMLTMTYKVLVSTGQVVTNAISTSNFITTQDGNVITTQDGQGIVA